MFSWKVCINISQLKRTFVCYWVSESFETIEVCKCFDISTLFLKFNFGTFWLEKFVNLFLFEFENMWEEPTEMKLWLSSEDRISLSQTFSYLASLISSWLLVWWRLSDKMPQLNELTKKVAMALPGKPSDVCQCHRKDFAPWTGEIHGLSQALGN